MESRVRCCIWSRALPAHRRSAAAAPAAVPPWLLQKWWSLGWLLERVRVPHVRVASVIWTYPIRCHDQKKITSQKYTRYLVPGTWPGLVPIPGTPGLVWSGSGTSCKPKQRSLLPDFKRTRERSGSSYRVKPTLSK